MTGRASIRLKTASETGTQRIGEVLAHAMLPGEVAALHGELGAGKTRMVRGMAVGLGLRPEQVSSPTYVLMHEYAHAGSGIGLIHIDAYRVTPGEDFAALGLDAAQRAPSIVAVEWPDRIETELPAERFDVRIEHVDATHRRVTITGPTDRTRAIGDALRGIGLDVSDVNEVGLS